MRSTALKAIQLPRNIRGAHPEISKFLVRVIRREIHLAYGDALAVILAPPLQDHSRLPVAADHTDAQATSHHAALSTRSTCDFDRPSLSAISRYDNRFPRRSFTVARRSTAPVSASNPAATRTLRTLVGVHRNR